MGERSMLAVAAEAGAFMCACKARQVWWEHRVERREVSGQARTLLASGTQVWWERAGGGGLGLGQQAAHLQRGGVGRADEHDVLGAVGDLPRTRRGAAQAAHSPSLPLTCQLTQRPSYPPSSLTYQLEPQRQSRSQLHGEHP